MWRLQFIALLALWLGSAAALQSEQGLQLCFVRAIISNRRNHADLEFAHGRWWVMCPAIFVFSTPHDVLYCVEPAGDQIAQVRVGEQRRSLRRQLLEVEESAVLGRSSLTNVLVCDGSWRVG